MSLGDDIRKHREQLQMTQPELAKLIGVSESTVSNWERDRAKPKNRLALVRQVLKMDAPTDDTTTEDQVLREEQGLQTVSERAFWAEAARRAARRAGHEPAEPRQSGHHAPMPERFTRPQEDKRLN